MPDKRCLDLQRDRSLGQYWERQFALMAFDRGKIFTPHQWDRNKSAVAYGKIFKVFTLPDITIWSSPGQHHEIKHKNPSKKNMYGLERYRIEALVGFGDRCIGDVFYTIHDWQRAGARDATEQVKNRIVDWVSADVRDLFEKPDFKNSKDKSWVNGRIIQPIEIWYWDVEKFSQLLTLWTKEYDEECPF